MQATIYLSKSKGRVFSSSDHFLFMEDWEFIIAGEVPTVLINEEWRAWNARLIY